MDIYEQIYEEISKLNDQNLKDILTVYYDVYSDIARTLKKNLSYQNNPMFTKVSTYTIDKYVSTRFNELSVELKNVVPKGIETAVSIAYGEALLSKYIKEDIKNITVDSLIKEVPTTLKNGEVVTKLKEVTMKDLLQATQNTEYAVKKLVRETFSKHLTIDTMLNQGQKEIANKIIKDLSGEKLNLLINKNMTGIVDRAGRRWNVETYVDMATKTKFHQAHVEGIKQFVEDYEGHGDLARIPKKNTTKDTCMNFEGMIISMTGRTPGYRTYAELKETNLVFHPRCRHNPRPYWDEESIPKSRMKSHNKISNKVNKFLDD